MFTMDSAKKRNLGVFAHPLEKADLGILQNLNQ